MKNLLFIVVTFIFIFQGCEKTTQDCNKFPDNTPEGLVHWDILNVEGPSTLLINQSGILEVLYPTSSGCDYVSEFVTVICGNNILVKAYGNTTQGTGCTAAAVPQRINYEFTPTEKGQFVFKFINRDNSIIVHNITIN
jgi:hypothetical protein